MAWLLERYGFRVTLLEGGYKAYRRAMAEFFSRDLPLHVITGYTGSKKTALLHLLAERGEQVVDLEGIAGHQGSSFGNKLCGAPQPTTEYFHNLLFQQFRLLDLSRPIWIEDENMRVGRVNMMESLFLRKNSSPHYFIEAAVEQRLDFLVAEYGKVPADKLVEATLAISKKLGSKPAARAADFIRAGQYRGLPAACTRARPGLPPRSSRWTN